MKFQLLEINLSTHERKVVDVSQDFRQYLGGRGYGAKVMWDRIPEGADPLGEENVLYIGVGPITGLLGAVTSFNAKSPLTLRGGTSHMNGHFGLELINAGYNAGILLTGKSSKPVYLYIRNDKVEIRDATHLWGKRNLAAQQAVHQEVRKELDDQNFRVLTIGPAGEHLVRNAAISHDLYHFAARLGMGAVMGAKNVKAIAVRGTEPPSYHNPTELYKTITKFHKQTPLKKAEDRRWGHSLFIRRYYWTAEGIKNKQLGWDPICDLSNTLINEQQYKLWNDGCSSCHVGCKVPSFRRNPPLAPTIAELRHDNAGGWDANVMLPGFDVQVYLTPYVDELGLDSEDVSGVVAWMMECYQRGLINKDELDGIDLTWGNLAAICKLLKKIAYREGIGDTLAEGLKLAPPKLKKDSEKYAITGKGVAITSYEPRGSLQDAVDLAVVPVGELHAARGVPRRIACDSLTICAFFIREIQEVFGFDTFARNMLRGVCGWDLSQEEWLDIVRRGAYMERCYCMREGYIPTRDDVLPGRFFEETIYNKYGKPKILNKDEFIDRREKIYLSFELDRNGIPPKKNLEKLDMGFVIPTLEKNIGSWD
ncbi:MAG: aldehyde ferredoxin oxidoreductase N-terminal domain-containing protein [Thermodesulfobacteriota bacterium]